MTPAAAAELSAARGSAPPAEGRLGLAAGLLALAGSLVVNNWAGRLASERGERAHPSPDLLHELLPIVDLRPVFVWGFAAFIALAVGAAAWRERGRAGLIARLYAELILMRSLFILLTPMRLPDEALWVQGDLLFEAVGRHLTFKHDLFFSSHTALPYLGFLIYRDRPVRAAFLALSIVLAATVLLTRLHYSIDVAGAYCATYALYRLDGWARRGPSRRGEAA